MVEIPYAHISALNWEAKNTLSVAAHKLFPGGKIKLVEDSTSPLYSPREIVDIPHSELIVQAQLARMFDKLPIMSNQVLFLDIETHNAGKQWGMPVEDFFRLGQYAWGEGGVVLTEDLSEVIDQITKARRVVAHNGHSFDFSVLLGDLALDMAMQDILFDTYTFAQVVFPCPIEYTHSNGTLYRSNVKPHQFRRWFGLDNLAHQFRFQGKMGNLEELARRYNPKGTKKDDIDYGAIPTDDPDFLAYAQQDIHALRELTRSMLYARPINTYDWKAQKMAAIDAQMSRNGVRVDVDLAKRRIEEAENITKKTLDTLVQDYDFPSEGKKPWVSSKGKAAIFKILADNGVTPQNTPTWTKTATGNPSLSGETLIELTKGTSAEELGTSLAQLGGLRPLAEQVLKYTCSDGRLHTDIDGLQRSGRRCLPSTHRILTRRGILRWDEVRPGEDETLDMRNRWVKITQVHHYEDAEVNRYETRSSFLEATPNHRWVNRTENGRREVSVVPFSTRGQRRVLQLTPDCYPFDKDEHFYPQGMIDRERLAALVGLLVTDGSCKIQSGRGYPHIRIYQTEGKFYDLFMSLIPSEWVTGDRVRYPEDYRGVRPAKTPMHEVSLDWHIVSPLLEAEGLEFSEGLRHSDTLLPWLLSLNQHETLAFLTSAYLADGRVASGGVNISALNKNIVPIFQIAAYRCGRRSNYRVYETVNGLKGDLHLLQDRTSTRSYAGGNVSSYNTDVWCVTTETGTFTAWYPEGRWSGPYLTGNSVTKPGLTTFGSRKDTTDKALLIPDPGYDMYSTDLSNADARAVAFMSGDTNRAKWFEPHQDSHELVGRLMWGDAAYEAQMPEGWEDCFPGEGVRKENPLRNVAKPLNHSAPYGSGPRKLAATAGVDEATAKHYLETIEREYPDVIRWQNRVREEGESGWVTNHWGRAMPVQTARYVGDTVERSRSYTQSPALLGQSSTNEVLYDGLIKLYYKNRDAMRHLKFPVHDELILQSPQGDDTYVKDLVSCMQQTINGITFELAAGTPGRNWREATH